MEFITEYGLFLVKTFTLVAAILVVAGGIIALAVRQKKGADQHHLEVTPLNREYEEMEKALSGALLSPAELKQRGKEDKKAAKAKAKAEKKAARQDDGDSSAQQRIFVIDFEGDIRASAVASLRQEISAVLTMARPEDEVLVRVESGGGTVHGYGLAASQLQRVRDHGVPLTVAVDKVAASGGYMMACVANTLLAAPFAIIGSIGVLTQMPNLHRLLRKHEIDFEQLSAGEYKRTLTMFGENTDKARAKVQEELEEMHGLFKDFVKNGRPDIDIDRVATGEYWLGTRALELGLVDKLQTSDDYLMSARENARLVQVRYTEKKKLVDRLSSMMSLPRSIRESMEQDYDRPMFL